MKYFILALLVAFSLTLTPAMARNYHLQIENRTSRYAWVTVWYNDFTPGWTLQHEICMRPHDVWKGFTSEAGSSGQLKVDAEVKTGDCRTGNIKNVYNRINVPRTFGNFEYFAAKINEHSGGVYGVDLRVVSLLNR